MIRLTDEEIHGLWAEAITDFRRSRLMSGDDYVDEQKYACDVVAKAQLKKVVGWAIEERRKLVVAKQHQKETEPSDVQSQVILGAKAKAFQQVIDKCGQALLEEIRQIDVG